MTNVIADDVDPDRLSSDQAVDALRAEVREFCESARLAGEFEPRCDAYGSW
jgi:hypothetical protein